MKNFGFLSFGHWSGAPGSAHRNAGESIRGHIDLAVAAEEAGLDGAWIRVHHFEQNLSSPFALLAAMGARTSRIELGTGVINMRYENPLYMAELAATADLVSAGRLQLGLSRGSPEVVADGPGAFGFPLPAGKQPVEDAAERIAQFRHAIAGNGVAKPHESPYGHAPRLVDGLLPIQPQSPGLAERIWYGAGGIDSAKRVGELGMHLMSSTLVLEATGEPFGTVQSRQIEAFRESWREAGHEGEARVSVSRSIMPIVDDVTRTYFGGVAAQDAIGANQDQIGIIDNTRATFGKTYVGEPEKIIAELREDEGVMAADTVLVTIPSQLGLDINRITFEALAAIRDELGD
ncbi:MAG: LLM class flavin-dependent oxidoreductase [Actinobacteria bacterium HGW-Actinobacteria-4]|nr:MAG: LLM class flavin-dependent oxidoreductase [Actinobacteria bacterium HGW-Actinobacteria-4]